MPVLTTMTWTVEGATRTAVVWKPSGTNLPIMFAFHGHGGTAQGFANNKAFETYWPNAIIVYPQGLLTCNSSGGACDQTGWQHTVGEFNTTSQKTDQDLKFYDAMLSTFADSYDPNFVFLHGWSNGGEFIYDVLWTARSSSFTALCNAAALLNTTTGKVTKPVMHIAGTTDGTVTFTQQQNKFNSLILTLDQCSSTDITWATGINGLSASTFPSTIGRDCVFLQYDGDHAYPDDTVPPLIIQFFKGLASVPTIFLSQVEMTPSGGQAFDEFYWLNSNNASLTKTSVTFPATSSYRFDISGYKQAGTPNIGVFLNNVSIGDVTITSSTPGLFSVFIPSISAGTYTLKIQLTNFNSAANYCRVGLLYFTQTVQATPYVYPTITPLPLIVGQTLKANHFGSGYLRGFSLGSNGYNQSDANGGNVQSTIDMVATGANIARCFVEIYRPNSSCEGGSSTADVYSFKPNELDKLARTIARAQTYRYYVVPCIFLDPCYNTDYWGNSARKQSIIDLWVQLANLYKDNPYVAAYDLINEPRQNFNYAEVIKFQTSIIDAIRAVDPLHVVMVECVDNDMFAMMLPLNYSNVVYSPHGYSTLLITHQGVAGESEANIRNIYPHTSTTSNLTAPWGKTQLSLQHDDVRTMTHRFNVPIFVGEFSCVNWSPASAGPSGWTSTEWVNDNISLLEVEKWSWVYHAWRGDYPGWEAEIPSSYYNSFSFSNATPQSLPGYTTWVSNRSSSAPTITMLETWFQQNAQTMATFYISKEAGASDTNNGTSTSTPWKTLKSYTAGNTYLFRCGDTFYMRINSANTTVSTPITISSYGTGAKPIFSQYTKINSTGWSQVSSTVWKVDLSDTTKFTQYTPASSDRGDVGFLKIDGVIWGAKVTSQAALAKQWDFFSDGLAILYVYSATNPGTKSSSLEVTTSANGVTMSNNWTINGIKVQGVGGTVIKGITRQNVNILNCDLTEGGGCFVGSGTTRFGAGISFDEGATNVLVDGNNITQIYEAGFTTQSHATTGNGFNNVTFSNNVTDKTESGYNPSIETGVAGSPGYVNVRVFNNTWKNAGTSWSHAFRPVDNQAVAIFSVAWDTNDHDLIIENNVIFAPREGVYYLGGKFTDPRFTTRNNDICIDPNVLLRKNFQGASTPYTYKLADHVQFTTDQGYEAGSTWSSYDGSTCTSLGTVVVTVSSKYGAWGNGLYTTDSVWNPLLTYINGFNFRLSWADIESSPGVFNWSYFDGQLKKGLNAGLYVGFMIYAGPNAPIPNNNSDTTAGKAAAWLVSSPYNVPYFTNSNGTWPYYLNTSYQNRWNNMIDNVIDHITNSGVYSSAQKQKILFWMSAEGSTGDEAPYKGTVPSGTDATTHPANFNFTISTNYGTTGSQWDTFKRTMWSHMYSSLGTNLPGTALLVNTGNDGANFQWLKDNIPHAWVKAGALTHNYNVDGEKDYSNRLHTFDNSNVNYNRVRGEFEGTDSLAWWTNKPKHNLWALVMSALHSGVDILNISYATANSNGYLTTDSPLFFFSKYAGLRLAANTNKGFIAFRDALDMNDAVRFPEAVNGNIVSQNVTEYNTAKTNVQNSGQPAYLISSRLTNLLLTTPQSTDVDYRYLNPARATSISNSITGDSYQVITTNQDADSYNNDFGVNLIPGNYQKFITQYSPNTTSTPVWRVGTRRSGRKFNQVNGEIFLQLDQGLSASTPTENVTVSVTYNDIGRGIWSINCFTLHGKYEIGVVQCTNTNTEVTKTVTVNGMIFGSKLANASDITLRHCNGDTNVVFYVVEFLNNGKNA